MAVVPRDRSGQVLHVELLDSTTYIDFRSIATEDPDKDETEVNITIQEERGEGEEEEEEGARGSGCAGEWRTRCCKCLEVIFLTTVVLLIWGVLSLPTVYHFQVSVYTYTIASYRENISFKLCSNVVYILRYYISIGRTDEPK